MKRLRPGRARSDLGLNLLEVYGDDVKDLTRGFLDRCLGFATIRIDIGRLPFIHDGARSFHRALAEIFLDRTARPFHGRAECCVHLRQRDPLFVVQRLYIA